MSQKTTRESIVKRQIGTHQTASHGSHSARSLTQRIRGSMSGKNLLVGVGITILIGLGAVGSSLWQSTNVSAATSIVLYNPCSLRSVNLINGGSNTWFAMSSSQTKRITLATYGTKRVDTYNWQTGAFLLSKTIPSNIANNAVFSIC